MTSKILIISVGVFQIAILILAGIYLNNINIQAKATLSEYTARKEDLMLKQQRIESLITDLNNSLNYQKAIQQNLVDKVAQLKASNLTDTAQNSVPSETILPPTQQAPTPPVKQSPPPIVTGAS
jgi:Na+-transporting NADH:ubiquinone oxidoreductase subunit NqrC